jgi:signal-transduction protein with cAMP-binding, CBS, and nucleotidyltransferase domain
MATGIDRIDKRDALRRTSLFGGLADEWLAELANRASEQNLAKGEMLFAAGEESSALFVVVAGAVRCFVSFRWACVTAAGRHC